MYTRKVGSIWLFKKSEMWRCVFVKGNEVILF